MIHYSHFQKAETIKIILKDTLKRIPLYGYAMQIFGFIFIKRSIINDKAILVDAFTNINNDVSLLLFPEGTVTSQHTKSKSNSFADKNGLKRLNNVLCPRSNSI